jgi:hypothetical protein
MDPDEKNTVSDSVLDPDGSAFNWSPGSGSAFGQRIRIQEQKLKKEKNAAKRQIIRHKKFLKNQCN